VSGEYYDNLQEIVERYVTPCNRSLRELINHPKFLKCNTLDDLKQQLEVEKKENNQRIPYRFTILEKYPQYAVLGYIPKDKMVREFIKIKPRGYFFHNLFHFPLNNLVNWFKQEFRNQSYQRFLRKSQSPQTFISGSNPKQMENLPKMQSQGGMQIDSYPGYGNEYQNDPYSRPDRRNRSGSRGRSPGR
jgi:hypothetical protein